MKTLVYRLSTSTSYKRIFDWSKLIAITGSAQLGIQLIGFLSGILVIRLLPTSEYAFYTLANTMLGTMLILADGGITNGVIAEGGKVWRDPAKFGAVMVTGLGLRRKFTLVSLIVALPALFLLLIDHEANWLTATLIILALIPAFFMSLSCLLLEVAPKIKQEIGSLLKIQLYTAFGRLLLLGACLFSFPMTFVAILASGIPQIFGNLALRRISSSFADYTQKADKKIEQSILNIVKRVMPGSIYFCFSGQITIWLVSLFGSTATIAQMGAIGRLGMMLSLFTALFNTLVLPRFSRLTTSYRLLLVRFLQLQAGLLVWLVLIVLLSRIFSSELLWILGSRYQGLEQEVILTILGTCLSIIAGINYGLTTSRGWTINPVLSISINICALTMGVLLFDISTLYGILILNIGVAGIQVLVNTIFALLKILGVRNIKQQR